MKQLEPGRRPIFTPTPQLVGRNDIGRICVSDYISVGIEKLAHSCGLSRADTIRRMLHFVLTECDTLLPNVPNKTTSPQGSRQE